ncbi:polyprenyl synthetase family protein [Kutzneria sp. CA-103260]|uniref:polyprenyl synthetase family protein n=1 Tax=Kutzneria sp. CA-103260 TaxID=2802641 RepID=UPI001BA976E0|nr:polyprenyl synthetase family protein [Kutzneria sp. CA-103260]QUQ63513.1 Heptaprenyl diphosphate synthase component 2 [Kutzneria sp. CA-103260]
MLTQPLLALAAIDRELFQSTMTTAGRCPEPGLDAGLRPLLARPGKRLRPALVFAMAACGSEPDRIAAAKCAAALELTHLSSLIHDDLIDRAESRGDLPTLHTSAGLAAAVVGGDYLIAVAGRLVTEVSAEAALIWHQAYADLCVGQARELANSHRTDVTTVDYLAAIRGKTAALMAASCRLGALCGGLGPAEVEAAARFGEAFGMVFQLVDDLMDVVATADSWGKPVGQDVPNGVYTAAVIAALEHADERFQRLFGPSMTPAQVDLVLDRARRIGTGPVLDLIDGYVREAGRELAALPAAPALADLPNTYVTKTLGRAVIVTERVS